MIYQPFKRKAGLEYKKVVIKKVEHVLLALWNVIVFFWQSGMPIKTKKIIFD